MDVNQKIINPKYIFPMLMAFIQATERAFVCVIKFHDIAFTLVDIWRLEKDGGIKH